MRILKTVYNKLMEKKIKAYEKFIEKACAEKQSAAELTKLAEFHQEMVANFQVERLIHLIITLFFVLVSLVMLAITAWFLVSDGFVVTVLPILLATIIIVILTGFYIKHYYFLENHIQKLFGAF